MKLLKFHDALPFPLQRIGVFLKLESLLRCIEVSRAGHTKRHSCRREASLKERNRGHCSINWQRQPYSCLSFFHDLQSERLRREYFVIILDTWPSMRLVSGKERLSQMGRYLYTAFKEETGESETYCDIWYYVYPRAIFDLLKISKVPKIMPRGFDNACLMQEHPSACSLLEAMRFISRFTFVMVDKGSCYSYDPRYCKVDMLGDSQYRPVSRGLYRNWRRWRRNGHICRLAPCDLVCCK